MPKRRNYKKGDVVEVKDGDKTIKATITGERCWQCRCISIAEYTGAFGESETCMNDCGPRSLCQMLRF